MEHQVGIGEGLGRGFGRGGEGFGGGEGMSSRGGVLGRDLHSDVRIKKIEIIRFKRGAL